MSLVPSQYRLSPICFPLVIFLNLRGILATWRFLFGDAIGGQCDRFP
jgi:hypothetical protein